MATDKSEPRVGLILKIGVLSIALLLGVHAALVAYFDAVAHAEEQRKYGDVAPEALLHERASEAQRLSSGPLPIAKAMQEMAVRGRLASPAIAPSASKDLAPLQGWSKLPSEVPPAMTAAEAKPELAADAGAATGAKDEASPATAKPAGGPVEHRPGPRPAPTRPTGKP